MVPDMVNTRRGAASHESQLPDLSQGIPHIGSFKDILAGEEEISLPIKRPCKVPFVERV